MCALSVSSAASYCSLTRWKHVRAAQYRSTVTVFKPSLNYEKARRFLQTEQHDAHVLQVLPACCIEILHVFSICPSLDGRSYMGSDTAFVAAIRTYGEDVATMTKTSGGQQRTYASPDTLQNGSSWLLNPPAPSGD